MTWGIFFKKKSIIFQFLNIKKAFYVPKWPHNIFTLCKKIPPNTLRKISEGSLRITTNQG
jgi:hypothetical protein